jgi:hypothetical protein
VAAAVTIMTIGMLMIVVVAAGVVVGAVGVAVGGAGVVGACF